MSRMCNLPEVKLALVGVSRNCFPPELARSRMARVIQACRRRGQELVVCETIVESEQDALKARAEARAGQANALAIYLGNFGPEGPLTILTRAFGGPFMLCAAAEDSALALVDERGDAFCGLLNASLNCGLRAACVRTSRKRPSDRRSRWRTCWRISQAWRASSSASAA